MGPFAVLKAIKHPEAKHLRQPMLYFSGDPLRSVNAHAERHWIVTCLPCKATPGLDILPGPDASLQKNRTPLCPPSRHANMQKVSAGKFRRFILGFPQRRSSIVSPE